jgi:hypothetical protein
MSERYQTRMNTTFYTPPEMFHTESTLRYKLRNLMLSHSPQEIYSTFRQMLEEDYTFLQTLFAQPEPEQARAPVQPEPPASVPATAALAQEPVAESTLRPPKSRPDMKIRVVKKDTATPIPTPKPVTVEVTTEKEKRALIKKEQADKVKEKNAELVAKGIEPASLLTKESLKKWVEDEVLTYAQIARDHVGLPADQIASLAKGYGFQSPIVKKRAMLFANK